MLDKSIVLEYKFVTDDLPNSNINNYLFHILAQISNVIASVKEKNVIYGGIKFNFNYIIDYNLHQDEDYQNLSLEEIFEEFYHLCQVRDIFSFVEWLNDAKGERIKGENLINILNEEAVFSEKMAKLIIKRIEEHVKIKTVLKRALYSHTSIGVKKGFKNDHYEDQFEVNDYDQNDLNFILYMKNIINKILSANSSLKYQSLSFYFIFTFQYKIKKSG